jgi:hypothetical protein
VWKVEDSLSQGYRHIMETCMSNYPWLWWERETRCIDVTAAKGMVCDLFLEGIHFFQTPSYPRLVASGKQLCFGTGVIIIMAALCYLRNFDDACDQDSMLSKSRHLFLSSLPQLRSVWVLYLDLFFFFAPLKDPSGGHDLGTLSNPPPTPLATKNNRQMWNIPPPPDGQSPDDKNRKNATTRSDPWYGSTLRKT